MVSNMSNPDLLAKLQRAERERDILVEALRKFILYHKHHVDNGTLEHIHYGLAKAQAVVALRPYIDFQLREDNELRKKWEAAQKD